MSLTLTERRTVVRALPRAVAAELAGRFPHAVEVTPTFDRRRYTLTARGYVGWVRVQGHTVTFRPKRPWDEVRCLFRPERAATARERGIEHPLPGGRGSSDLLDLLAARLAALMLARAAAGLQRGYVEHDITDTHVRGRIDLPSQLRKPFRSPTLFDQIADEWTPDIPVNRVPKAVAVRLLAEPGLSEPVRAALARAVSAFADVSDSPVSVVERGRMSLSARATHPAEPYRELLDWCDLIGTDDVLVSLERAFEGYVTRAFGEAMGERVRIQEGAELHPNLPPLPPSLRGKGESAPTPPLLPRKGGPGGVGPVTLTPDLTVFRHSSPASVWDAKWKKPDATAADVHQALAYAAVLGVPACGLVYPGRRWKLDTLTAPSGVALYLLRLPLTDDPVRWAQVVRKVGAACRAAL